ncbi:uncharacterized SAM-binding protein YcdF (DUF218 family) [Paenibacillus shirakamiensis]|uniref:Uncharacterized SAM-binding protein YcdF (DUF218 family) n=1 Tax=Paenibacillus shirakamiensis TaxID=1265935 RepID=A0ABS4JD91_9BACL|nr:YdcF family protein [Paenibacillus shirakamiensis]MBP1999692.1 uncharacterized SAM-binding protein YcdF (DUF218 family) [Paenibacillus shirakamiensis]
MNLRIRDRNVFRLLSGIGVLIILGLVWCGFVAYRLQSIPSSSEIPQKADVGIVLGAALWGDQPSPGLAERLNQALYEYNRGSFTYFIVSGGYDTGNTVSEAQGMANFLKSKGVPAARVLLEDRSTSTVENLQYSQQIMKSHQFKTAIIITHTFHGRRALEIATYLNYTHPQVSLIESKVINQFYYRCREILAYTKWKLTENF